MQPGEAVAGSLPDEECVVEKKTGRDGRYPEFQWSRRHMFGCVRKIFAGR